MKMGQDCLDDGSATVLRIPHWVDRKKSASAVSDYRAD